MKKITEYVNVFQGNSTVCTEQLQGISRTWAPIKGLSGNTHPGAQLPFGKISVGAYSGGYPTGYGNNRLNCGEPVEKLYDKKLVCGISHLHHSGTGAVGFYYNYALTTPFVGSFVEPEFNTLSDEKASPGYYSAKFKEKNIIFELTTDRHSAFHKYIFPDNSGLISIDFSNDGLYSDTRLRGTAGEALLKIEDTSTVTASVVLQGLTLHFTVYCNGGKAVLWEDYKELSGDSLSANGSDNRRFGVLFKNTKQISEVILTLSLKSRECSIANNLASRSTTFEHAKTEAESQWESALSKIQIETDDRNKEIFYSNLYHTLTKPSDWSGESIYYPEQDFVLDFTTLWDIYKTQLPLLFAVYPEISKKIVSTYLNFGKRLSVMPNMLNLSSSFTGEAQQARFLAGYLFCDAYYRGVKEFDWNEALDVLKEILLRTDKDFFEKGECSRTTHTLDMAEACKNLCNIAVELGRFDVVKELELHSDKWKKAFDFTTGLLFADSEYYEGNHWNYSFRPMNSMEERIAITGEDGFVSLLDRFFGFTFPNDKSARFEGFNNETDMEAPYAYNFVNRQDRLSEIIECCNKYMFTTGEGGAPGNVDSGGLSACYLWNTLGVFPVSGQNLMLVGMPYFEKASIKLSNEKSFEVVRLGKGSFVKYAVYNGVRLNELHLKVTDMMQGGTLELYTE